MTELLKNLGYYNGKYDLIENMTVPMSDRVCWFGDGVYDATATRNGVIYCLDDHIDRFFNSASMVEIEIPYTKEELKELLKELVSKVDTTETNGDQRRNIFILADYKRCKCSSQSYLSCRN